MNLRRASRKHPRVITPAHLDGRCESVVPVPGTFTPITGPHYQLADVPVDAPIREKIAGLAAVEETNGPWMVDADVLLAQGVEDANVRIDQWARSHAAVEQNADRLRAAVDGHTGNFQHLRSRIEAISGLVGSALRDSRDAHRRINDVEEQLGAIAREITQLATAIEGLANRADDADARLLGRSTHKAELNALHAKLDVVVEALRQTQGKHDDLASTVGGRLSTLEALVSVLARERETTQGVDPEPECENEPEEPSDEYAGYARLPITPRDWDGSPRTTRKLLYVIGGADTQDAVAADDGSDRAPETGPARDDDPPNPKQREWLRAILNYWEPGQTGYFEFNAMSAGAVWLEEQLRLRGFPRENAEWLGWAQRHAAPSRTFAGRTVEEESDRLDEASTIPVGPDVPTPHQRMLLGGILEAHDRGDGRFVLNGPIRSGKTWLMEQLRKRGYPDSPEWRAWATKWAYRSSVETVGPQLVAAAFDVPEAAVHDVEADVLDHITGRTTFDPTLTPKERLLSRRLRAVESELRETTRKATAKREQAARSVEGLSLELQATKAKLITARHSRYKLREERNRLRQQLASSERRLEAAMRVSDLGDLDREQALAKANERANLLRDIRSSLQSVARPGWMRASGIIAKIDALLGPE